VAEVDIVAKRRGILPRVARDSPQSPPSGIAVGTARNGRSFASLQHRLPQSEISL
jgi:hypothetical protein